MRSASSAASVQTIDERCPVASRLSGRIANGPAGRKCSSARPLWSRSWRTVVTMLDWPYSQPWVAMPARSRIDECAPSAATSRRALSVRAVLQPDLIGRPQRAESATAALINVTPSALAFASSAASSGPFSIMCANGSSGPTSPSKVRNVGRMASSRRLSVTAMSRIGCAPGAIRSQTPMVSNSRRAAATIADARGSLPPRSSAGSATTTLNDAPSACRKAIASDSPAKPAPAIRMSTCLLPSLLMVVRVARRCPYQIAIPRRFG